MLTDTVIRPLMARAQQAVWMERMVWFSAWCVEHQTKRMIAVPDYNTNQAPCLNQNNNNTVVVVFFF